MTTAGARQDKSAREAIQAKHARQETDRLPWLLADVLCAHTRPRTARVVTKQSPGRGEALQHREGTVKSGSNAPAACRLRPHR